MIRKLAIQNFRCIRGVEVELTPLTAFVGTNASGKSAFLAALHPGVPLHQNRRFHDPGARVRVSTDRGERRTTAHAGTAGSFEFTYQLLRLDLDALRSENVVGEQKRLQERGNNLVNTFESLGRSKQAEVARRLCEVVPVFRDLDTRPTESGKKEFRFYDRWSEDTTFAPREVSDGTMLMLAFLLVPFQDPAVDVLCIEEPERGLHPYLMATLVEQLRTLTRGDGGHPPVQVVLATQSAELLNHLEPGEVRFLRRNKADGSVIVDTPDTETVSWKQAFDEYEESLGHLWLSGGLGGVPG